MANSIPEKVSTVYTSPSSRTVSSAKIFINSRPEHLTLKIDDRLREINYGVYIDNRDCSEMTEIAKKQIAGDYEIRFSSTGENKREIIYRFFWISIENTRGTKYKRYRYSLFSWTGNFNART